MLKVRERRDDLSWLIGTAWMEQQPVPPATTYSCHPINEPIYRRHSTSTIEKDRGAKNAKKKRTRTLTGTQLLGPPELRLQCIVCLDRCESVAFQCSHCRSGYCHDCLKNHFLKACKDESLMPPKCCSQLIGLVHVCEVMTVSEVSRRTFSRKGTKLIE